MLDIGYQVNVSHNQNLEDFSTALHDNNKHEMIIKVEKPLVEKRGNIKDGKVSTSLDIGNYF